MLNLEAQVGGLRFYLLGCRLAGSDDQIIQTWYIDDTHPPYPTLTPHITRVQDKYLIF